MWKEQNAHECFDEQLIHESLVKHYAISLLGPELKATLSLLTANSALVRCKNAAGYTISDEIRYRIKQEQNDYNALLQEARLEFLNAIRPLYEHGADGLWAYVVQNVPRIVESLYRSSEQKEPLSIPAELAIRAFVTLAKENPSSSCAQLLELWAKRAILIHRLSIDPTFEQEVASVFRKNQTALLLDTNVLIGLFGASGDSSFEHLLSELSTIAARLGPLPLLVTQRTIDEYQYALKKFLGDLQRLPPPPQTRRSDLSPSFLKRYMQGDMNKEQFGAYFSDIDSLENIASERYKVKLKKDAQIDHQYFLPCTQPGSVGTLSKSQQAFCKLFQEIKDHIYKTMPLKSEKGLEVVEHDSLLVAYTLLLNNHLQTPADLRLLLITEDKRLKELDVHLMQESRRIVPYVYTLSEFVINFGIFVSKVDDLARLFKDALNLMYVATLPTDLPTLHAIEELTKKLHSGPDWTTRQLISLALERTNKGLTTEEVAQREVHVHVNEGVAKRIGQIVDTLKKEGREFQAKQELLKQKKKEACVQEKKRKLIEHEISAFNLKASRLRRLNASVKLIVPALLSILVGKGVISSFDESSLWWGVALLVLAGIWWAANIKLDRIEAELQDRKNQVSKLENSIKELLAEINDLSEQLGYAVSADLQCH